MPIMRSALILLSQNRVVQDAIAQVPVSRRMARRFVAGETLADAIAAVQALNQQGLVATLDHLGENVTTEAEAASAAEEYLVALDAIHLSAIQTNVSVKLSQMGLDVDEGFCVGNFGRILRKAAEYGNFVRVDMEGSDHTERTIAVYRRLRREYDNVGIAIQAYLRRSKCDVDGLIEAGMGNFRLCKGAYDEPPAIAYSDREQVTQALNDLVCAVLSATARDGREHSFCAVASHDERVINFARAYAYRHGLSNLDYEFQMLYGIRRELQLQLVRQGHRVRIYVPYGTHWYPYFMRRLAERPANLLFFLRALVGN